MKKSKFRLMALMMALLLISMGLMNRFGDKEGGGVF